MTSWSDARHDAAVSAVLPEAAAALAAVCVALAVAQDRLVGSAPHHGVYAVALVAAAALAAVGWVAAKGRVPSPLAHPVAAGAVAVVAVASATQTVLTGHHMGINGIFLAFLVAGAVLVAARWFWAMVAVLLALIAATDVAAGLEDRWPAHGVASLAAIAIAFAMNRARRGDVEALAAAHRAAEQNAVEDPLTGALNGKGLALLVAPMLEGARRRGDAVHCHVVDVDGLQEISGLFGVAASNEMLMSIAEALRDSTRGTDVVARWDTQIFLVVGPGAGMVPEELERRVATRLAGTLPVDLRVRTPRVIAGSALLTPWDSGTLESLVQSAGVEMRRRRALRRAAGRRTPARAPEGPPLVP